MRDGVMEGERSRGERVRNRECGGEVGEVVSGKLCWRVRVKEEGMRKMTGECMGDGEGGLEEVGIVGVRMMGVGKGVEEVWVGGDDEGVVRWMVV